jgi:DNA-binding Lrp family transcriptional regulator
MSDPVVDALDLALLTALDENPRAGVLELSRILRVARATVASRLQRLEQQGVVTGYGPDIDLASAGYSVQAFVTLEIAQGSLGGVAGELAAIPGVLEAFAVTGSGDVLCKIAAASHADLQATLVELARTGSVARSTSVVVLSTVVAPRVLPLLASRLRTTGTRAPAFRVESDDL